MIASVAPPDLPTETLVRGSNINLQAPFLCGGRREAGRYVVQVDCKPTSDQPCTLRIQSDGKTLCESKGVPSSSYDAMKVSKLRVFTRVNQEGKAIQVDVVVPDEARSRIKNQVFQIPLATGR
jgi:hypothetical protein